MADCLISVRMSRLRRTDRLGPRMHYGHSLGNCNGVLDGAEKGLMSVRVCLISAADSRRASFAPDVLGLARLLPGGFWIWGRDDWCGGSSIRTHFPPVDAAAGALTNQQTQTVDLEAQHSSTSDMRNPCWLGLQRRQMHLDVQYM